MSFYFFILRKKLKIKKINFQFLFFPKKKNIDFPVFFVFPTTKKKRNEKMEKIGFSFFFPAVYSTIIILAGSFAPLATPKKLPRFPQTLALEP